MRLRSLNSINLPASTEQTITSSGPRHAKVPLLTSTIPWLMAPYCLFLSITRLMTMTVAMATAMTNSPMRALLLRLKSSRRGPTDSYNKADVRPGLRDSARRGTRAPRGPSSCRAVTAPKGAPGSCFPSNHPHKENSHFSPSPRRS